MVVENGKSEEAEAEVAVDAAPENGSTEAEPEVTSTPAAEEAEDAADEAKNGDRNGMYGNRPSPPPFHPVQLSRTRMSLGVATLSSDLTCAFR